MMTRGRSLIAAFMACAVLLAFSTPAHPSYNSEAGRKYTIASQRLTDLKKSPKKKKYRSYWIDCIRTFESVEKKYPKSPVAAEACFDRSGIYEELYHYNRYSKDIDEAVQSYGRCQAAYPKNPRAPEALYHVVDIALDIKKNREMAAEAAAQLARLYPDSSWHNKAAARITPSKRKRNTVRKEPEIRNAPVPVISAAGKTKPGAVQKIRYWSGGAYTRIVIEQDKAVSFQAYELKNPDRLVFDLYNARLDSGVDKEPLPVHDGILKQVRASQYARDTVRVVLDLESIKNYVAFALHEPERLVIDVTGEEGKSTETRMASADSGTSADANNGKAIVKAEPKTEPQATVPAIPKVPEVRNNDGDRLTLSRQMALKVKTIAIDAGHGGHDPGAIGKGGTREKNLTLDIARRLSALVKERLGCNVVMTRDKDVFIPLDQRPFIAKSKGADLFVSIHVNANRKRKMRGVETYIQGLQASDREAMATAARENAMSTKSLSELDSEIDKILRDLKQDNKLEESLQLAHTIQASLVDSMKPVQPHVVNLGVKRAFFYVLINTQMPSILAEVGFISNPEEEKMLRKESYRQAIAEALFQGVKNYITSREPQLMGI